MKIRKYLETDLYEMANVISSGYQCEPWNEDWSQEEGMKSILSFLGIPASLGLVGIIDGIIVAALVGHFEVYRGEQFFINHICVLPEYQKKGYGTQMLKHLEELMRKRGCKHLELMTLHKEMDFYIKNKYIVNPHINMCMDIND